jgi:hypothetical protein
MKALVVYESLWGNTETVARSVAAGLAETAEVSLADVRELPEVSPDVDLLVAGGPTHAFSMTRASTRADAQQKGATHEVGPVGLREWLDRLPEVGHHPVVATFDTRVDKVRHLPGSAARSAAKSVRRHGYGRARTHSFYVSDIDGPLLPGEQERAAQWGRELAASED